jgi:hypothetical protein
MPASSGRHTHDHRKYPTFDTQRSGAMTSASGRAFFVAPFSTTAMSSCRSRASTRVTADAQLARDRGPVRKV